MKHGVLLLIVGVLLLAGCTTVSPPAPTPAPGPTPTPVPFITANTITGPSTGEVGQTLTYSTSVSSNIAGSPEYQFDWGDGSLSSWSSSASALHSWSSAGTYTVRAQARHPSITSEWSSGMLVTVTSPSSSPTSDTFLEAPTEVCPGDSITVKARLSKKGQYLLRIAKRFPTKEGTGAWFENIGMAMPDDNFIANWHFTMPYLKADAYELEIVSEERAWGKVILKQPLQVNKVVGTLPISVLPRSPCDPEIMRFYITPDAPDVKAVVDDILAKEKVGIFTDFEVLRDWVAWHVSYRFDQDVHSVSDYWQLPAETLKLGTGDCEDFAILLCSLLRAYGVPSNQVYVACGFGEDKTHGHAYLVEKWYQGIWRVTEPQAGAWAGVFMMDWATSVSYEELCCFNDQDYFEGPPTLPLGVYEFQLSFSARASATFERYMSSGEMITASVEWLGKGGNKPDPFTVFGWRLRIYAPDGRTVLDWFGGDLTHSFSYLVPTSGKYRDQVYIGGVLPTSGRLTIEPADWEKVLPGEETTPPESTPPPSSTPESTSQTIEYVMPPGSVAGSRVSYSKQLDAGEQVSGFVELSGEYHDIDWSYGWHFQILGPGGEILHEWKGHWVDSPHHDFSFMAAAEGKYTLEIKHASSYPKNLIIEIQPPGWG